MFFLQFNKPLATLEIIILGERFFTRLTFSNVMPCIYSQCTFKHTHTLYCMQAWLYDTPSQLTLEKLEHGGLPCTGSLLDAVHLHDVLQRRSCINHRIVVRYSGEVQQDFHRTHGITCIKCRTCRWLLFVRAVPFVSTVLIIRHIAIRLGDQGANILFPNDIEIAPPTLTYSPPSCRLTFAYCYNARRCLGDRRGSKNPTRFGWPYDNFYEVSPCYVLQFVLRQATGSWRE